MSSPCFVLLLLLPCFILFLYAAHFREPFCGLAKPLAKLTSPELRAAWYYRLHFLWPWLARPALRRGFSILGWGLFGLYLAFTLLVLVLRYGVLPDIQRHQPRIEAAASAALGLPVRIGELQARWTGLHPVLVLRDVRLEDMNGAPALSLERVEGVLSWRSLLRAEPLFSLLSLERPALQVRRDAQGELFVAGLAMSGPSDGRALAWVLAQARIRIVDATVLWEDEARGAPPLLLEDLQFELHNAGRRHRFGVSALPAAQLRPDMAARLDVRGELYGNAETALTDWRGRLYTRLDHADLAVWRAWVDYPLDLPQGQGALQLWLEHEDSAWQVTADLALRDVRLRLAPELPELALQRLDGRLELEREPTGLALRTRALSLATADGLALAPLDLALQWQSPSWAEAGQGKLQANRLDLAVLAGLARHLPLNATSRQLLTQHQPQGRLRQLELHWDARGGDWKEYRLEADFDQLGLHAHDVLPGARGLTGRLEASQAGGRLSLDTRQSALYLPAVFAEPEIPLERLVAQLSWKPVADAHGAGQQIQIERLSFSGPHADGQLSGSYRTVPDGPGLIDLQGGISRAQATEAWRYIPRAVNADVPAWLRQGLLSGTGTDARLTLKGDLKDFPFRDPATGIFLITAKARGVNIHYADGWPGILGVDADMRFGVGMQIKAHAGTILGARLGETTVEIPDFESMEEMLLVRGKAQGPTAEFLRFIEKSPVAASIDHFTEGMRAQGSGRLELSLDLPLRRVEEARILGSYLFEANQIHFLEGLPSATAVQGRLEFTEAAVRAPQLRGNFLGRPMQLQAVSEAGGVVIRAQGGFTTQALAAQFLGTAPQLKPWLAQLAGGASWQAEVKVKKKDADFRVTSSLQGLSSSLPPPFNKTAGDSLALRLEKTRLEADGAVQRETLQLELGEVLEARLLRRQQGEAMQLERGGIGIGQKAVVPERGVQLGITQARLDLDAWRLLLDAGANGATGATGTSGATSGAQVVAPAAPASASTATTLPLQRVVLQVDELVALGRSFHDVSLRLRPDGHLWRAQLAAREALGEISWDGSGKGAVTADLKRLRLAGGTDKAKDSPLLQSLPAMNIRVGDFSVGARRLGRLDLQAENAGSRWNLRQILLESPDGRLSGSGVWETAGESRTHLDFRLQSADTGKLLERLGYPGAIKGGTAELSGKLDWAGAPVAFDPASLGGQLQLDAARGQFSKVEPGVGKLLGLLSLQSITRRLSLDFRDVFNDGFAYDRIAARMEIRNGVMRTQGPLEIDGPSGDVLMQGTVDMRHETQDLLVTIHPEVGGVAAVGAAVVINPVVGAAALLAQNLLQDPLNKAFGFQLQVSGSWVHPQIDKVDKVNRMNKDNRSAAAAPAGEVLP